VISSLGALDAAGAAMGMPNGEMDPWADRIVATRFRYIQVSAYYDQRTDVPAARLPDLPANPLGAWIAAKQPKIWPQPITADQVAVAAICLPTFATAIERVAPAGAVAAGATAGPDLVFDRRGPGWLVTESDGAVATAQFWELLRATH